jgi:putative heme iron utilization protein
MRRALKGSLGTIDRRSGHPYVSLVTVATEPDGTPVFLISRLAAHTQNLTTDPRASLLLDGTGGLGDPLTGSRVTVLGFARRHESATVRARFLARHPGAQGYIEFADFAFYALEIRQAHYVGGFGRILGLQGPMLHTDIAGAQGLIAAESEIIAHMNTDHADALALYATRLLDSGEGAWRMTGIDPEGLDLVLGDKALRLLFSRRVTSTQQARTELARLVEQARAER